MTRMQKACGACAAVLGNIVIVPVVLSFGEAGHPLSFGQGLAVIVASFMFFAAGSAIGSAIDKRKLARQRVSAPVPTDSGPATLTRTSSFFGASFTCSACARRMSAPEELCPACGAGFSADNLVEMLQHELTWNGDRCMPAIEKLDALGPKAASAVPKLLSYFRKNPKSPASRASVEAIVNMGQEAIPFLLEGFEEQPAGVRRNIAKILGRLRISTDQVVEALSELANGRDKAVASAATEALEQIHGEP